MVRISVVSPDKLFASMLCNEIGAMSGEYKTVNEKADVEIIDLDGDFIKTETDSCAVIGFSRNEALLPEDLKKKCRAVLHRPFLVEDLQDLIKNIWNESEQKKDLTFEEKADMTFDFDSHSVELNGNKIPLSLNECAVLRKLYENQNSPVSRSELNEVLSSSGGNMCDVYICHLRSKLENGNKKYVFTVRGKGYMLKI